MSRPDEKQNVHLMVRLAVTPAAGESAEEAAANWLNALVRDAPGEATIKPRLPVLPMAEYQRQALQTMRQLEWLLETRGEVVPDSFREILATAEPSAPEGSLDNEAP